MTERRDRRGEREIEEGKEEGEREREDGGVVIVIVVMRDEVYNIFLNSTEIFSLKDTYRVSKGNIV